MAIKPTYSEIITECQMKLAYLPNCADTAELKALVDSRINDVDAEVQLRVGANYSTADARIILVLHKAEIYLTCGRLWQMIKNVVDQYDAEDLPPEYVSSEACAANRDWYLQAAEEILGRYEDEVTASVDQLLVSGPTMVSSTTLEELTLTALESYGSEDDT